MTVYFSPTAAARHDQDVRATFADGLRHGGLDQVATRLAHAATVDPPTFREIAAERGWAAAVDQVNTWAENGYEGDWFAIASASPDGDPS